MRTISCHLLPSKVNPVALIGGCVILLLVTFFYCSSSSNTETVNLNRLLEVSIHVAIQGGDRLWSIRKGHSSGSDSLETVVKGKTKEGADELLTKGDLESHYIIHSGLKSAFPRLRVVSEEHDMGVKSNFKLDKIPKALLYNKADDVPLNDVIVWIDPLDATQEYSENLLHYVTTMVCVAVKGVPTIGVIYRPFGNELVWGYVNHGLSANLVDWLGEKKKKNVTKIVVSRSHAGDVEKTVKASMDNVLVVPAGGAGFKVIQLVNSSADAYVHTTHIKKWDVCAGNAILNAANGQMTTLLGDLIDYSDSKKPLIEDGLLATLNKHQYFLSVLKP